MKRNIIIWIFPLFILFTLLSGCNQIDKLFDNEDVPPPQIASFSAVASANSVILSWSPFNMSVIEGIEIRKKKDVYPLNNEDGTRIVYTSNPDINNYIDANVINNTTYYYALWTFGSNGDYSENKLKASATPTPGTTETPVPPGESPVSGAIQWRSSEGGNNHWYYLVSKSLTWEDSYTDSLTYTFSGYSSHMATITSSAENAFVFSKFNTADYWLGGTDRDQEGQWKWVTGEEWTYSNWIPGEPNNSEGIEDGMHLKPINSEAPAKWNDIYDHQIFSGYILEVE
jgi:hypothetical protein